MQVEPRLRERTLTVNGVSKVYSMTGWRIGYAGGPAWLIRATQTLRSQSTSNPSTISQAATLAALEGGTDFLLEWIDELRTCSDLVVDTMARCPGLRCDALDGAFYAFVDCSGAIGATTPSGDVIATDLDFANYLLAAAHVGVVHGSALGVENHVRIAYAVPMPTLRRVPAHRDRVCGVDTRCRRGPKRLSTRRHARDTCAVRGFFFLSDGLPCSISSKTLPPSRRNSAPFPR
ncbi:aminotransferase class I/II-fold pyridoxal phosphate-dependent enzyme, partial [Caballeronia humi]|uniref:aminotransferase class I/II-fold pyridoxal phosphate-dependent enzyme n=1 Tax=Caballeronia humi TaxID=326474 RepID=UPI000A7CCD25